MKFFETLIWQVEGDKEPLCGISDKSSYRLGQSNTSCKYGGLTTILRLFFQGVYKKKEKLIASTDNDRL